MAINSMCSVKSNVSTKHGTKKDMINRDVPKTNDREMLWQPVFTDVIAINIDFES